jgi:CRP-like cAMP-binding protein
VDSFLAKIPFLKGLRPADEERVSRAFVLRRHSRGETIFSEGAAADAVYLLRSGLVKAVKLSPKDDPVIL